MKGLVQWSIFTSMFSVLIPISFLFSKKNMFSHKDLRIVRLLLGLSVLFDIAGYTAAVIYHHTLILNNIFFFLQIVLLHWMYWEFYERDLRNWKVIKLTLAVFVFTFFVNSIFFQGLFEMQSYTRMVGCSTIVFYGFHFLDHIERHPVRRDDYDARYNALFSINLGVVLYFMFNFWLFTLDPAIRMIFNEQSPINIWAFHNASNILKNILIAVGIYWTGVSMRVELTK